MKRTIILMLLILPATMYARGQKVPKHIYNQVYKLGQAYGNITRNYIDSVDSHKLAEEAIKSMLAELDPHSEYLPKEDMQRAKESFAGKFAGIGVSIAILADTAFVTSIVPDGPAAKAGVRHNDRIVSVEGKSVVGLSQKELGQLLRGDKRSKVTVGIVRGRTQTLTLDMERDVVPITTVDAVYLAAPKVGYIRVNRFAATTMREFKEAFDRFDNPEAVILDLRDNPGGLVNQALQLAGFFLPKGSLIISEKSGTGHTKIDKQLKASGNGEFTEGKVVVLIDDFSASASEIVAGALQDWDRAVIVGRRSFGKGLVQREFKFKDGSAMNLTTCRYLTPSGRAIQRPFANGKPKEYQDEFVSRVLNANDSLAVGDSLRYKTLRLGKTVYGGGGIYPDYYVRPDSAKLHQSLLDNRLTLEFGLAYLDANRERMLLEYPDMQAFKERFVMGDEIVSEMEAYAKARDMKFSGGDIVQAAAFIKNRLRFMFAQSLYGLSAAYKATNHEDPIFAKALEIVGNWDEMSDGIVAAPAQ